LKRRNRLIGWTFLVLTVASIVVAYSLETLYSSSGSIVIEQPEVADQFLPGTYQAPDREQRISRINDEVMTRDNLAAIIEKHNLYPDKRGTDPVPSVIPELRKNFELEIVAAEDDPRRKYVGDVIGFVLTFYHPDPQTAKNVASDIVNLFMEGNKRRRQEAYMGTAAALTQQAEDIRITVAELESQLADFKTENPGALPEDRTYNRQIVERKERDLSDLDREIRSLQERKTLLQSQLAQTDPYITTIGPDGEPVAASSDRLQQLLAEYLRLIGIYNSNHPDVVRVRREIDSLSGGTASPAFRQALEAEYTSKQIALADARTQYGSNHPDVLSLQRSLAALGEQIDQLENSAAEMPPPNNPPYLTLELQLRSVDIELGALQRDKRALQSETSELDKAIQIAPEVERRYLGLSRDLTIARQQYEDTMARRMAVERAGALEASDLAERYVLTRAPYLADTPAFPNRPLIILIGIFMGVTFGLGMGILAEVLDDSIRNTRDIRAIIGAPPIAAIPLIRTAGEARAVRRSRRMSILTAGAIVVAVAIYVQLQINGVI
jgi:uncharacterized protein involved in exopolysaccharide biosynthesis